MILAEPVAALALLALISTHPQVPERAPAPAPAEELAARADIALGRGDWVGAIQALTAAERARPLDPGLLLKLGTAHARAGHELAAIAWFQCYRAVVPGERERAAVAQQIPPLQLRAEARIRRILQEGGEALREVSEVGAVEAETLVEMQQLAVQSALVNNDLAGARQSAAAVDASQRDVIWTSAAEALAAEGDLAHADEAALNVADAAAREDLRALLTTLRAATRSTAPVARQWEALAIELSSRPEIVNLNQILGELARADAKVIPVRLMELGSGLRAWFGKIQRLADETAPQGREPS